MFPGGGYRDCRHRRGLCKSYPAGRPLVQYFLDHVLVPVHPKANLPFVRYPSGIAVYLQLHLTHYPAQNLAIMGVSKRWQLASNADVVAECGSGKTLIALGSMLVHSGGRPYSGLVMAPPHLVEKWARETFLTLPQVRVFLIDDMRNGGDPTQPHGINEVRLRRGEITREGLHTSLAELRRLGRKGWRNLCPGTTIFCIGREKDKLSYFWKHCYGKSRSGRYLGSLTNPDTGCPIETDGVRISALDFEKKRLHQIVEDSKAGKTKYSALWQADGNKIVRVAPAEYWDAHAGMV